MMKFLLISLGGESTGSASLVLLPKDWPDWRHQEKEGNTPISLHSLLTTKHHTWSSTPWASAGFLSKEMALPSTPLFSPRPNRALDSSLFLITHFSHTQVCDRFLQKYPTPVHLFAPPLLPESVVSLASTPHLDHLHCCLSPDFYSCLWQAIHHTAARRIF